MPKSNTLRRNGDIISNTPSRLFNELMEHFGAHSYKQLNDYIGWHHNVISSIVSERSNMTSNHILAIYDATQSSKRGGWSIEKIREVGGVVRIDPDNA